MVALTATNVMPRRVLQAIGIVLLGTLIAVAAVRLSGTRITVPDEAAVAVRELRFEDRPDGSVVVIDATTKSVIHTMTGENGFFRGALRGACGVLCGAARRSLASRGARVGVWRRSGGVGSASDSLHTQFESGSRAQAPH